MMFLDDDEQKSERDRFLNIFLCTSQILFNFAEVPVVGR